ncbi:protein of unknown function [Aminobacter niigataensis]|nr:protein of unknown function [Aminobacter niigataensis]
MAIGCGADDGVISLLVEEMAGRPEGGEGSRRLFSARSARRDGHGMDPRVSAVRFAPAPPEDDEGMVAFG